MFLNGNRKRCGGRWWWWRRWMMSNPMNEWRARGVTISAIAFSRSTMYVGSSQKSRRRRSYSPISSITGYWDVVCLIGFSVFLFILSPVRTGIDPFCSQCNYCWIEIGELWMTESPTEELQRRATNYYSHENIVKTTDMTRKLSRRVSSREYRTNTSKNKYGFVIPIPQPPRLRFKC